MCIIFIDFASPQGKGVLSETLVWCPPNDILCFCTRVPTSLCMCLPWSLQIQTRENNFSNCRYNWQASVSRLRLPVLSRQDAPESHYSHDGIVRAFRFPITVLKIPHFSPGWSQRPGRWDGGKAGCTPAATLLSQGGICVGMCVFACKPY